MAPSSNTQDSAQATQPPNPTAHPKSPPLPPHNAPRIWFITAGASPIGISVARQALKHGDCVIAALSPLLFSPSLNEAASGAQAASGAAEISAPLTDGVQTSTTAKEGPLAGFTAFVEELRGSVEDGREGAGLLRRLRVVRADGRVVAQCQAAIAEATTVFGRIDIVLACNNQTILGSVEELSQSSSTLALVRDQFETNYFATVNIIRAVLPSMRARNNGHIIVLTGTTGNLSAPGMGVYCASHWAIEGFCDSLTYEIAPFNIRLTTMQPNTEIPILTSRITCAAPLPYYTSDANPAPPAQEVIGSLVDRLTSPAAAPSTKPTGPPTRATATATATAPGQTPSPPPSPSSTSTPSPSTTTTTTTTTRTTSRSPSTPRVRHTALHTKHANNSTTTTTTTYTLPPVPSAITTPLVAETAYALLAIGGHDNPPARHIVGFEAVAATKEKIRGVGEEVEEYVVGEESGGEE